MYEFLEKDKVDNLIDFEILFNKQKIGVLEIAEQPQFVFIRQIHVDEEFQRLGHATKIIYQLLEQYKLPLRYCVSTHSNSAIIFWRKFNEKYQKEVKHIKGDLYELTN